MTSPATPPYASSPKRRYDPAKDPANIAASTGPDCICGRDRTPSPWDCAKQGHVPVPEGGCLNCGADTTVPIPRPCGHHGYRCDYDTCPDVEKR